jgi:hypothetical protein
MTSHHRVQRIRAAGTALLFAGAITTGVSGVAAATAGPTTMGASIFGWLFESEAHAPTEPDIEARPDDVWTSECDGDGNCQSVPGFMDPGPGAPGGPHGPLW